MRRTTDRLLQTGGSSTALLARSLPHRGIAGCGLLLKRASTSHDCCAPLHQLPRPHSPVALLPAEHTRGLAGAPHLTHLGAQRQSHYAVCTSGCTSLQAGSRAHWEAACGASRHASPPHPKHDHGRTAMRRRMARLSSASMGTQAHRAGFALANMNAPPSAPGGICTTHYEFTAKRAGRAWHRPPRVQLRPAST